jgi:hypothetical protein
MNWRAGRLREQPWRAALVGGLGSIPATVGLYWLSGAGNEMSLSMVFVGAIVAGGLARSEDPDCDIEAVGVRTGIVGAIPGLWFVVTMFVAILTGLPDSPTWFLFAVGGISLIVVPLLLFGLGVLAGVIGASLGAWLVDRSGVGATRANAS